ncbi:hypothetical protein Tco_0487504, partial [Tanacetum coccineum]
AAHAAAGSTAEAHPEPYSPPISPVRESTPKRQPETEWIVPNPISPVTDWRPWPFVPAHSPIRDLTPEPAQTVIFEVPLVFGPAPRPVRDVDPAVIESIIFGPQPRPHGYVDPDFVEPIIFGPHPRPDNYLEPEDLDNLLSMEDDTTHGGFHVESPVGPDDAPTPTADAAGRAEDPALLTSLSAKLDRCMGRIDSLETELGKSKKIMGGAILTLVSRVKKLEKTVKKMRDTRLVVDASTEEGDVDIQDDIDLDGLSRMASAALGQPAVPSDDVEEREEEEVPLRRKRSAYRRARTEFTTPAFEQFRANISAGVLPHTAVPEPAGLSVAADKGKAPLPELDIPAEFEGLPNVFEAHAKELDDLMMRMTETDWLNLMMQVGSNPALARELLGADVTEENFIERMTAVKERKKRALADLRYRALKGKPLKKSEVTQLMRNLVKNQWCAAHNGTITMKDVKAMNQKQLVEEYEYICRRLEQYRLLSAQYNLFRPKPAITEPPSKRQRVERASSQPASVPAAITHTADDPDSAGGGSSNPAGSAFGAPVTDSTITTPAAMDSVNDFTYHALTAGGPSSSNVSMINYQLSACHDEQNGFQLTWLTAKKGLALHCKGLWCVNSNVDGCQVIDFQLYSVYEDVGVPELKLSSHGCLFSQYVSTRPRVSSYLVKAYQIYLCCCKDWKLLFFDVATSFDSAVHRVHAVSFDAAVLDVASSSSSVSAGYIIEFMLEDLEAVPADYVPAGHVLISADRYRIC